ncbi:MAG: acyl-CoA/acyl-ACP dehydrogenase [Chloroflexi bacterium]|nr:acyl-CoA/acyl-ACP dehydrogenase [Chloroflexota bacterium]
MDLGLNEAQEMLKKSAREFLEKECPKSFVRAMEEAEKGYTPELWRKIADVGWLGLALPEKYGGTGGNFLDLAVLLEEMGRALLPGPFFSTAICSLAILEAGTDEQKAEFLPKIASGDIIMALALTEPSATYDASGISLSAERQEDHYVLNGAKLFVNDAHVADYLLCVARTGKGAKPEDGITIFAVNAKESGISCNILKTIAADKQCEVLFEKAEVPQKNILGALNKGWPLVEKLMLWAAVGKCAEMLGQSQKALEMTVEYAKQRIQFGRPIGSFQAVQHHCANMLVDVDSSRFITYEAAWKLSEGLPSAKEVSMAKAWVSDATRRVVALGHQVHGGIGFTKEHDMQLYFRRAKAAEVLFGDGDYHREIVAREMGL